MAQLILPPNEPLFCPIFSPYLILFLPRFHVRLCWGRVKSASFSILFTHIASFDIFRNFVEETERWTTFSRKEYQGGEFKPRKSVARKSGGIEHTQHNRTHGKSAKQATSQVARPGHATCQDRAKWLARAAWPVLGWFLAELWHGYPVPPGTTVPL